MPGEHERRASGTVARRLRTPEERRRFAQMRVPMKRMCLTGACRRRGNIIGPGRTARRQTCTRAGSTAFQRHLAAAYCDDTITACARAECDPPVPDSARTPRSSIRMGRKSDRGRPNCAASSGNHNGLGLNES